MNEVSREPTLESLPLGPEQRALAQSTSGAQHALIALALDGELQPQALRGALVTLAARHATLAYAYASVPGYLGLRAVPQESMPALAWEVLDLAMADDPQAELAAIRTREQARPLALAQGQPWRAVLCRLAPARWELLVSFAVLAADRGSRAHVMQELVQWWQGYAFADVEQAPLPYAQYVAWRHDLEQDADAQVARDYWRDWQAGAEDAAPLRLPYRRERGAGMAADAGQPNASASVNAQLDVTAVQAVLTRAQRLYADGFDAEERLPATQVVMQAAWWALLARIAGQTRYAGGWLHDCRRDYDMLAGAVGRFEKVLPLAFSIDLDAPFDTFARALSNQLEAHREGQEYWPVMEPAVKPRAGFGLLPPAVCGSVQGLAWRMDELAGDAPAFELALLSGDIEAGMPLRLVLHFDPHYLGTAAAHRLLEQYQTLLLSLGKVSDVPLAAETLVGPQEAQALRTINQAPAGLPAVPVPQQLQAWAQRTPAALALQWDAGALDYASLQAHVDGWARRLLTQGVKRGDVVALDFPLSGDLVVALLAVMRAGAAYLPMDPSWPAERRDRILALAQPVLRLAAAGSAPAGIAPTLEFDLADSGPDRQLPLPQVEPGDAAYLIYTSGSTGTPKGVVIEHAQLSNYVAASGAALGLAQCRRFGLISSVAADLGNTALFGALCHGAALIVASQDAVKDAQAFARYIADNAIDCLKIVPSHLAALLDEPPRAHAIASTLVLGGEATPAALVRALRHAAPHCRIFNHYGPTETTIGVLVHEVPPGPDPEIEPQLPLSRALDGNTVLILNAAAGLAATGELGELVIGGSQVCRGYLGLPDDARFFETPLAPGLRFYRSGDLARHLPQGGLALAGRSDHQVKIRGYRVEPAEIESVLLSLPDVMQAAVRAVPDSTGALRLAAYVAGPADERASQVLRSALHDILPAHMVPASIVVLDQLPRLPNGKLDPAALPDPDNLIVQYAQAAPQGDVEHVLATLVAELLERDTVSATEDLFEQGADSLMVIKLVARIRRSLQLEIPPGLVFDHASVRALALALVMYETEPGRLAQVAAARRRLDTMSPAERASLAERGRQVVTHEPGAMT